MVKESQFLMMGSDESNMCENHGNMKFGIILVYFQIHRACCALLWRNVSATAGTVSVASSHPKCP